MKLNLVPMLALILASPIAQAAHFDDVCGETSAVYGASYEAGIPVAGNCLFMKQVSRIAPNEQGASDASRFVSVPVARLERLKTACELDQKRMKVISTAYQDKSQEKLISSMSVVCE